MECGAEYATDTVSGARTMQELSVANSDSLKKVVYITHVI